MSCCLLGFTSVCIETCLKERGAEEGKEGVACSQHHLPCPLLPAPLLPSGARHGINLLFLLWVLQIAGSTRQDVGSLSLSAPWLTFLPLEEFGRPWDSPLSLLPSSTPLLIPASAQWSFSACWSPCCGFALIDFRCWHCWLQYQTILHVICCISWGNLQDIY